jgi:hypothetical protein
MWGIETCWKNFERMQKVRRRIIEGMNQTIYVYGSVTMKPLV